MLVEEAIATLERERADLERRAEAARQAEAKRREDEARRQREAERREAEARHQAEEEEKRRAKAEEKAAKAAAAKAAREQEERDAVERKRAEADARRRADEEARIARAAAASAASASAAETVVIPAFPSHEEDAPAAPAGRTRMLVAGGVAAVVLVGVVAWLATRTASPAPAPVVAGAPASVLINIRPWAKLDRVERKSDGQAVDASCAATPCLVSLAPGEYHARASNPYFQPLEFDFTVTADSAQEVRQALPGLKTEDEVRRILGGG